MKILSGIMWFLITVPGALMSQVMPAPIPSQYSSKISSIAATIHKKGKTEIKSLKHFFRKAHRNFLKEYKAYATLNDVFEKGSYDCLSGTYFLSVGLNELGIKHRIIETNYHVFLIAQTKQGEVLLESTDRMDGFVADRKKIGERISGYRNNALANTDQLYLSHVKIYREILPGELLGLFYFNQAVVSFHQNDFVASSRHLEGAWKIYDNPRIYEFAPILIRSILLSHLDEDQKTRLTAVLKQHLSQSHQTLAVR